MFNDQVRFEIPPNNGGKTRLFTNICGVFSTDALWRGGMQDKNTPHRKHLVKINL